MVVNLAQMAIRPTDSQIYNNGMPRPVSPVQFQGQGSRVSMNINQGVPSVIPGPSLHIPGGNPSSLSPPPLGTSNFSSSIVQQHKQEQARVNKHLDTILANTVSSNIIKNRTGFKSIIGSIFS